MRRIPILRLLILALLLTALSVPALAASCVRCGGEAASDDYLCTACLVKLLEGEEVASPLTITQTRRDYEGSVTLIWTDAEGNGPYRVLYELLDGAPTPFGWTACESTPRTHCVLDRLVPGVNYICTVVDSKGNTAEYTYYAPRPEADQEIGARIRIHSRMKDRWGRAQRQDFLAHEIMQANGNTHGISVRLTYSRLAYGRLYDFDLAVTAPNGFTDVVYSGKLDLHDGVTYLPEWSFVPLDSYFDCLERYYGAVPTGEYAVTLFFNGAQVHTDTFEVGQ